LKLRNFNRVDDIYAAIKDMTVRGAPAIGVAGAYGMYLSTLEIGTHTNIREHLKNAAEYLISADLLRLTLAGPLIKF